MLEGVWFWLAELQMDLGQSEAAERSFAAGVQAMEEAAAQFPADSPRRVVAMTTAPTEQALLSLRAGRYAAALDQSSAIVKRLDNLVAEIATSDVDDSKENQHLAHCTACWKSSSLPPFASASTRLLRLRRIVTTHCLRGRSLIRTCTRPRDKWRVARALAGQGERDEARATLEPALRLAARTGQRGYNHALDLRQVLAEALLRRCAGASGRSGGTCGKAQVARSSVRDARWCIRRGPAAAHVRVSCPRRSRRLVKPREARLSPAASPRRPPA